MNKLIAAALALTMLGSRRRPGRAASPPPRLRLAPPSPGLPLALGRPPAEIWGVEALTPSAPLFFRQWVEFEFFYSIRMPQRRLAANQAGTYCQPYRCPRQRDR